jgi:hypothetical protein
MSWNSPQVKWTDWHDWFVCGLICVMWYGVVWSLVLQLFKNTCCLWVDICDAEFGVMIVQEQLSNKGPRETDGQPLLFDKTTRMYSHLYKSSLGLAQLTQTFGPLWIEFNKISEQGEV